LTPLIELHSLALNDQTVLVSLLSKETNLCCGSPALNRHLGQKKGCAHDIIMLQPAPVTAVNGPNYCKSACIGVCLYNS